MAITDLLRISGDKDYAPYSYLDGHGKPRGLFIDIWDEYSLVTGTKVEYLLVAG